MSLPEIGGQSKGLILLAQMKREKLRKDLPQIFQSCTFNRSVTSPIMHAVIESVEASIALANFPGSVTL
jgi:hypothetical protein